MTNNIKKYYIYVKNQYDMIFNIKFIIQPQNQYG